MAWKNGYNIKKSLRRPSFGINPDGMSILSIDSVPTSRNASVVTSTEVFILHLGMQA